MTTNHRIAFTPRVEAVLDTGDLETLMPLLAAWSQEELRLLLQELCVSYASALEELDDAYRADSEQFHPLLSPAGRDLMQQNYHHTRAGLVEVFREIEGAVRSYLKEETEKV